MANDLLAQAFDPDPKTHLGFAMPRYFVARTLGISIPGEGSP